MPSRLAILAATPICPIEGDDGGTCAKRLEWFDTSQAWGCEDHGFVYSGRALARQRGYLKPEDAKQLSRDTAQADLEAA